MSADPGAGGEPRVHLTGPVIDQHGSGTAPGDRPFGGGSDPFDATSHQPPFGQAPFGQAPFGQAPFGEVPFGDAPFGEAAFGEAAAGGRLTDALAAAGALGRQGLELIAGAVRGVAAVLRVSATAGLGAALVITLIWDPAFAMRWWKALILLGVLALPGLEVLAHRLVLVRLWGDAERLEKRARSVSGALVGGPSGATGNGSTGPGVTGIGGDFARRMAALHEPGATAADGSMSRRRRAGMGAARSALGLRDVAGAIPGVAGVVLFPLRKALLQLTAICTALCWVLLVVGVPVGILVGIGAALSR